MEYANNPLYIKIFIRIAVAFLVRAGHFNKEEAEFEVNLIIERIGLEEFVKASGKTNLCNVPYCTMIRKGAKTRKNRQDKVGIALTLDRAVEHALYELIHIHGVSV